MKKRIRFLEENHSSKQGFSNNQDVSVIQDSSNKENISNKQVRSRKQIFSKKQMRLGKEDSSNKQDVSINLKSIDPDCLMDKFSELYISEYETIEQSQAAREHAKEILDELLRVEAITKRQYNTLYKKCEE